MSGHSNAKMQVCSSQAGHKHQEHSKEQHVWIHMSGEKDVKGHFQLLIQILENNQIAHDVKTLISYKIKWGKD